MINRRKLVEYKVESYLLKFSVFIKEMLVIYEIIR